MNHDVVLPMFINTIENCYNSIVIVGNNTLADQIYKYLLGNKMVKVQCERSCESNVVWVSEDTEIVIFTEKEHPYVRKKSEKSVYAIEYEEVKRKNSTVPFSDIYQNIIVRLLHEKVRVLVVKTPDLHKYRPRLPLYMSMYLYRQVSKYLPNRDSILLKHLGNANLLNEFKSIKTDNLKGYLRVHGNGEFINYDDGWRRVPVEREVSEEAPHIYLFGYCISANPMLADNETIAANLQKLVEEKYRVCSRSNDGSAINFIMRSIHYKAGDIVVLFTSYHDMEPEKMGLEIIDLSNMYVNIPQLWRHITDSSFHCDAHIAREIAAGIIAKIDNMEINDYSEICFGGEGQRAPQISMYNDIGLEEYVSNLKQWRQEGYNGAIVMNCNPFTLGHQYLIRRAASMVDYLFVFVVQEDKSYFKFEERLAMVKCGVKDINNVIVIPTGNYMISSVTLPGYFDKSHLGNIEVSASDDLELFASICGVLNISIRFAGTEPKDGFTRNYNSAMREVLPNYGIQFHEIERLSLVQNGNDGMVISATIVRDYLEKKQFDKIKSMVPETTYDLLKKGGYLDKV